MCRRFKIIANIENITIPELNSYIKRLFRLYVILSILSILTVVIAAINYGPDATKISIVGLILYIINTLTIGWTGHNNVESVGPSLLKLNSSMATVIVLLLYNLFRTVLDAITTKSIYTIFAFISLLIQISTFYILYKFRGKVIQRNEQSLIVEAIPTAPVVYNVFPSDGINKV